MSLVATPKCIVEPAMAASGDNTIYTVPAATTVIIDKFTACNTDSSNHTLAINVIPSGGSVGASNLVMNAFTINANTTKDFTELQNQILNTGDQISVNASSASVISVRVSGRSCA